MLVVPAPRRDNPIMIRPSRWHCPVRGNDCPCRRQPPGPRPVELDEWWVNVSGSHRSALTSFDNESGVETVVNGIEHVRMVVRSVVFDEISHSVGDFLVFSQSYHWFAGNDLSIGEHHHQPLFADVNRFNYMRWLFFHQCFQRSLRRSPSRIDNSVSIDIGDFGVLIVQNDPRAIPIDGNGKHLDSQTMDSYNLRWSGLFGSGLHSSVLMSMGSMFALQYSWRLVIGFSIWAVIPVVMPKLLIGVLDGYWLIDEGGRPERTESRPYVPIGSSEFIRGKALFRVDARDRARSAFSRCKACATPLDLNSSWSLKRDDWRWRAEVREGEMLVRRK